MSPRTVIFTRLYTALRTKPVTKMSPAEIERSRRFGTPDRRPYTWVVGAIPAGVVITESVLPVRDGTLRPVRLYRPAPESAVSPLPVVVYFHGGGWALGSTRQYDALCGLVAGRVGALVASVDYRMAPEHVAPQAVLDCVDAVHWAASQAETLGGDPSRLALCGDSAGGNLAAVVARVLRDEGGPAVAHQALIYPGTDATMSHPSVHELAHAPILGRADIEAYLELYVGRSGLDPKDPLVSPLWADDLTGLPPALVQTADLDPLRDEGLAYASRLEEAGVAVRATNYLGAPHGFMSFPGMVPGAEQARLELVTELRRHLR